MINRMPTPHEVLDLIPSVDVLRSRLKPDTARRVVYIPFLIGLVAVEYTEKALGYCAAYKFPFRKEARTIRDNIQQYLEHIRRIAEPDGLLHLQSLAKGFAEDKAEKVRLEQLYYTIRKVLVENYPGIPCEYPFIYANVARCLLKYERHYNDTVVSPALSVVHRKEFHRGHDENLCIIDAQLVKIVDLCKIPEDEMTRLAVNVIANALDKYLFSKVEFQKEIQWK